MKQQIEEIRCQLPSEAIPFFVVFSRFEYALKRSSTYLRAIPKAEADWDKFAAALGEGFFKEVREGKVAQILVDYPPWKQVAKEGKLDWEKPPAITSVNELFLAIRRVRNNIVHGGKFPDPTGPVFTNSDRDKAL